MGSEEAATVSRHHKKRILRADAFMFYLWAHTQKVNMGATMRVAF